jgi:hypothetical protein
LPVFRNIIDVIKEYSLKAISLGKIFFNARNTTSYKIVCDVLVRFFTNPFYTILKNAFRKTNNSSQLTTHYILRTKPGEYEITLGKNGYRNIDEFIIKLNIHK